MDPYQKLLTLIRDEGKCHNPVPPNVGRVISVSPIRILFRGISLDDEELKINKILKTQEGYSFEVGSEVLVLPTDNYFILVCEVV